MRRFSKFLVAVTCLLLVACGEDKTLDEHQRERLQENLAVYQSVAGRYTGKVSSAQEGKDIGALEVVLRADVQVNPNGGGESSQGSPILVANIRFLNRNIISLSAHNSFYDSKTGAFNAQIDVKRSETGGLETMVISGNLAGGSLTGELNSIDYPEYGSRFRLEKNGPKLTDLMPPTSPEEFSSGQAQVKSYEGTTVFQSGAKRAVQIVVLQPLHGTAEDILDLLSPIRNVDVSFNYSQSLHILYTGAILDSRQHSLTGEATFSVNGQIQRIALECRDPDTKKMYCNHLTTGAGVTASTSADLTSKPSTSLPKDPQNQPSITKAFVGKGIFGGKETAMKVTVTQPSRGRLNDLLELFFPNSEKIVNVAVDFSSGITTSFIGVKWDSVNGLIDGSMSSSNPSDSYTAYIQCYDFYFTKTSGPFTCNYWTSRSPNISIDFKPPYK